MTAALTSALLHSLWQGAAIALALAVALCFARSSRTRYTLACSALIALPLAFAATIFVGLPSANAAPRFVTPFFEIPAAPVESSGPAVALAPPMNIIPFWFAGIAIFYAYRLAGWLAAQRLRRRGVCAAPAVWQQRLATLARRPVKLLESALTDTPLTIGALRPVILVPLGLLANLPSDQVEAILLHELAHIRRHDYLINLMQTIVEGMLFYHPAAWWISHIIRQERELCCDDLVVAATGDAGAYARALSALEQHRAQTIALAATGGPLMTRIHRILGNPKRRTTAAPALGFLLLATATALFAFHPEPMPLPEPIPSPAPAPKPEPTPQPNPAPKPAPAAQDTQPQPAAQAPQPQPTPDLSFLSFQRLLSEARLRSKLETPFDRWINQEVVWIASNEERTAFYGLTTDDERQMFIEQFWLRRDPTPDTQQNEFRDEYYRRIAWANDRFGTAQLPGWKSDRGMMHIKFGPPDEREENPGATLPFEKWTYRYIEGLGYDIVVEFVDAQGTGQYRMTWDPNEKNALLRVPGARLTLYEAMFDRTRPFFFTPFQRPEAGK
ncbi:MAG: GWxTD domain-containing protein [Acidobacteriota bacterium]